ncbi:hypothetical protein GCM10009789_39220 [Kribbella sancticallisti]|uniref:Uncharacterized protein n=1 Tax=Kribbella sancticallisti TaxID=460087 RepID=A0ABN2DQS3_9ACTN
MGPIARTPHYHRHCPSTKPATPPAKITDQLGPAKVSITQDVYLGRRAANPAAAEALGQAFEDLDLV